MISHDFVLLLTYYAYMAKTPVKEPSGFFKNLLAEIICHFNTQNYKNLRSQAWSRRFLYVGYSLIMIKILT